LIDAVNSPFSVIPSEATEGSDSVGRDPLFTTFTYATHAGLQGESYFSDNWRLLSQSMPT